MISKEPFLKYVLVSPARNEAAFIERTLQSVTAQTLLPLKWVIVSDGSTDATNKIVADYVQRYNWIELIQLPPRRERHFAGKVHAFNAGYSAVRPLPYNAIGSLDADISFDPDYFAFLLQKLAKNPSLGLVGTPFEEGGRTYDYRFVSTEHVSGACQLFRRECFEVIGGYIPREAGGIDHVAVITARMKGWKTQTFTEKTCHHHRKIGSANQGILKSRFRDGALDYALGGDPRWELFRTIYQMSKRPFIIGGLMIFAGYFSSLLRRKQRAVSPELVRFRRNEQMTRLRRLFTKANPVASTALGVGSAQPLHTESR